MTSARAPADAGGWYDGSAAHFKSSGAMMTGCAVAGTFDSNSTWFNNVFRYTDGPALSFGRCGHDTVENNVMEHIDYSAVGDGFTVYAGKTQGGFTYRRNTVDTAGASAGLRVGAINTLVELNYQ